LLDSAGRVRVSIAYPNEPSMKDVIESTLVGKEYDLPGYLLEYLKREPRPNIVDVGANVGAAAIFFHHLLRKGAVYSFEPALDVFDF
jgi:hypothetical protein